MGYVFLVYCNIVGMELSGFDARVRDLVNPWFRDRQLRDQDQGQGGLPDLS